MYMNNYLGLNGKVNITKEICMQNLVFKFEK